MNGFPLVILGVVLFAVAYALLKIQGKMKEVTAAIDSGFKTIEDAVTQNLTGPNGALTKATTAVDQGYNTVKTGIDNNVLGTNGVLSKGLSIMTYANTICLDVGGDIKDGKNILKNDIRKTTGDIETILQDASDPLIDAGVWFTDVGNKIDIDIAGAHPLQPIAQPFKDVGKTMDDVGDLCISAKTKLMTADQKIILAENALDDMSVKVKSLGGEILQVRDYVNTEFTNGINASVNDLKQVTDNVKLLFLGLEQGAQASVTNLKNANTYLDSLLVNMFQRKYIVALFSAGVATILAGVAIGL